jgi:hypothetical protein
MAILRSKRPRISLTVTVLLGLSGLLIVVGLVCAVLGVGGIVTGSVEVFGAKITAAPLGVVLIVLSVAFAVALLKVWPKDWEDKGYPVEI